MYHCPSSNFNNVFNHWFNLILSVKLFISLGALFEWAIILFAPAYQSGITFVFFLIWETLSFNLMYVAGCYPVGTTISKTS